MPEETVPGYMEEAVTKAAAMLFPGTKIGPVSQYPHLVDAIEAAEPAIRRDEREKLRAAVELLPVYPTHDLSEPSTVDVERVLELLEPAALKATKEEV
jgi:hypothetical protein